MTRNYPLWRSNIRQSYARSVSNRRNRGAWSNPNADFAIGVLDGGGSWRSFSPIGGVRLTIAESYHEEQASTTTYVDSTPTSSRSQVWTGTCDVDASVARERINLDDSNLSPDLEGDPLADSEPRAYHYHQSTTPYGEGLYDCFGSWLIDAQTHLTADYTDTSPIIPDYSHDSTERVYHRFDYSTIGEKIRGLSTKCRWTAKQAFHGPAIAYRPDVTILENNPGGDNDSFSLADIPFLPAETDPDGQPGTEVFWTDQALRAMVSGEWSDEVDVVAGTASRTVSSYDETSHFASESWSHHWTRSGSIQLKFFHSAPLP